MATLTMGISFTAGSISITGNITRELSSQVGHDPILPAAQAGTLTTRTDTDTGVITLDDSASPTPVVNDKVTVFWSVTTAGVTTKHFRYNMDVTAVGATTINVDGGSGDDLPTLNTEVTVGEEVAIDTDMDGDLVELFAAGCSAAEDMMFRVDELVGTDATPVLVDRISSGEAVIFDAESIFSNPFAGITIGAVVFARAGVSAEVVRGNACFGYDGVI